MRTDNAILLLIILALLYYIFDKNVAEVDIQPQTVEQSGDESQSNSLINKTLPSVGSMQDNLLVNGEFESSLDGWDFDAGVYWSSNGGVSGGGSLLINPPEVKSESRAIYSKGVRQCVPINGTSKFSIGSRFRYLEALPSRPSINRIHVYWFDTTDCSRGGQYGTYLEPNLEKHVWQNIFKKNLTPSLGAKSAEIRIEQRQDGNNNAEAIWDDVLFIETEKSAYIESSDVGNKIYDKPMGYNYIVNPEFNRDINHWKVISISKVEHRVINDDENHGGTLAATLPNQKTVGMGVGSFNQCINLGTSERYELGAQVKIDPDSSQRGGGRLRVTWYEGTECKGRYRAAQNHIDIDKNALDWQDLHVNDLIPEPGSKSANIGVVHSIEGDGQHTLFWDNFYFKAY